MNVDIVCFGAMREHLPDGAAGNRATVTLRDGATAGEAVDALGAPRHLIFALLVDGEQATLDTVLDDGAEVTLMPPFSGGSHTRRGPSTGKRRPHRLGGSQAPGPSPP